jgi:hypothetical protein
LTGLNGANAILCIQQKIVLIVCEKCHLFFLSDNSVVRVQRDGPFPLIEHSLLAKNNSD